MIANKTKFGADEALKLAHGASRVIVGKGKKVLTFDMRREPPDDDALLKAMLGPTGNLRAPVIRRGKTLLVGFNEEAYQSEL